MDEHRVVQPEASRLHRHQGGGYRDDRAFQVLGDHSLPLSEITKRDILYTANSSLWEDIRLLVQTAGLLVSRRGI